jgi:hypothetical protein
MTRAFLEPTIACVSEPLRLVLELDPQSEPIRGTVTDPDGHTRECLGWLALIQAVDEWRRVGAEEEQCPGSPSH